MPPASRHKAKPIAGWPQPPVVPRMSMESHMKKLAITVVMALAASGVYAKDWTVIRFGVNPSYAPFESNVKQRAKVTRFPG